MLGNLSGFVQIKNLDYDLGNFPLSEADKANGIEGKGRLSITAKLFRNYRFTGMSGNPLGWSEWRNWDPFFFSPQELVDIVRVKGQWQVVNDSLHYKIDFSCSQIPG